MSAFDEKTEENYPIRLVYESLDSMRRASINMTVIEQEADALFLDLNLAEVKLESLKQQYLRLKALDLVHEGSDSDEAASK
uniref:AlNc14C122G6713 protein n=1 Tax=Albugo laibachii Nc14 TaxID=890382 RepID=F0WJI8_9STRA|nr:AlNc14C122G6713 [Albugo laibachii Nc14]|eukprot:CCA21437.1 AlNc14C122G6713 [Albugo laibachii Nc14]